MNILRWHIQNLGESKIHYIEGPWKHGNRHSRRADEAKVRQKADTPHGAQKRRPRNWKRKLRARRKLGRR